MVAAELQDSLLVVMHDLHRLEGLLNHATDNLLERFGEANAVLTDAGVSDSPELVAARAALRSAVTELAVPGHGIPADLAHHQGAARLCLPPGLGSHGQ